jgi:phosphoribosylaminoimidazole-succinocarboxamide synthase
MKKKNKLHKGSSKTVYGSDEEYQLVLAFNDEIPLTNDQSIEISGKGVLCNSISAFLMEKLDMIGVEHHFVEKINMRQQLVQYVEIYPIQVRISNVACSRYITDFGLEEGLVFETPVIDFRVKNRELNYPIINEHQINSFGWLSTPEIRDLKKIAIRTHDFLTGIFAGCGIRLVECCLEFGRVYDGEDFVIMLSDEISPDTCRLWDLSTNRRLCFELAHTNPDEIISAYTEVAKRLGAK